MNERWLLARRRNNLLTRARMIQAIRQFFISRDYLEIETPIRVPTQAPEAHIDPFTSEGWFLHTSPELCMKRILAAGYPRLFQITRCFRAGERGALHIGEFTLLEWYRTEIDYKEMMKECEDMFLHLAELLCHGNIIHYQGTEISLGKPWERISVRDAFREYSSLTMEEALKRDRFDEIMVSQIEPRLGLKRPAFLYDYPASLAALARLKKDDPTVSERFELYLGGLELANAFSELTDVDEQRTRFEREQQHRRNMGKPPCPEPERFLAALPHMPEASGIAMGIDRLAMIFTDSSIIDDIIAFTPEML
ncbi:MAG: EF-P lysine aminoacylase EpmA [Desulfobacterales bacterium]|nr:EF-P lysine aminoacylase EpmA [Desulfobacterales bacterium]